MTARARVEWGRLLWAEDEDSRGFARRLFWTAAIVYALFFNPYVQSSMTWNFLDLTMSLLDSRQPFLTHTALYAAADTARSGGAYVSGEPLGPSLLLLPLWAILRWIVAPSPGAFVALNAAAVLLVSVPAGGAIAVLTYWHARRFGASERNCRLAAWLCAFGTPVFAHATMYTKELLATLACLGAVHLASGLREAEPRPSPGICVGLLASLAGLMVYPLWLLLPALLWYLRPRVTPRALLGVAAGALPVLGLLLLYNRLAFGSPLVVGYLALSDAQGGRWAVPTLRTLWDMTLGSAGGTFFYHPILLAGLAGLILLGGRPRFRREAALVAGLLLALLAVYAAWLTPHYDNNAFIAALGLRMLLPVAPLLMAPVAALEGRPRGLLLGLGLVSVLMATAFAAAGLVPGRQQPLDYIGRVSLTTLGGGLFFSEALPRALGVDTLHTLIASHRMRGLAALAPQDFLRLAAQQLGFRALSLAVMVGAALVLARKRFVAPGTLPGTKP